jgi:hypothetical protein
MELVLDHYSRGCYHLAWWCRPFKTPFYLEDHRVGGQIVIPGALYVKLQDWQSTSESIAVQFSSSKTSSFTKLSS